MPNYNRVALMGNVTRDIDHRTTQSGMAIAKFGMAINRKTKDQETTCFVDCTAFGKSADLISQYVRKGSPIFVDGRLEYSTWEAKDGGGKRSKLEVVVENFQFLSSRDAGPESAGERRGGGRSETVDVEDIPF